MRAPLGMGCHGLAQEVTSAAGEAGCLGLACRLQGLTSYTRKGVTGRGARATWVAPAVCLRAQGENRGSRGLYFVFRVWLAAEPREGAGPSTGRNKVRPLTLVERGAFPGPSGRADAWISVMQEGGLEASLRVCAGCTGTPRAAQSPRGNMLLTECVCVLFLS